MATPKNFGAPEFNDSESDNSAGHNELYDDDEDSDQEKDEKQDTEKKERIFITDDVEDPDDKNFWLNVGNVKLTTEDQAILESSDMWLNDKIVNAAQILLSTQFPYISGFQDTLLQKNHQHPVLTGEFIQIVNERNTHWITVSTLGVTQPSILKVYDSMRKPDYGIQMKEIFAALIHAKGPSILLAIENVQQQSDSCSCGLFAIAFATAECFGQDPRRITFDVSQMRSHLQSCLENRMMQPFKGNAWMKPHLLLNMISSFRIYCSCRMPHNPINGDGGMLQCNLCDERFHKKCEKDHASQWYGIDVKKQWYCKSCCSIVNKRQTIICTSIACESG